MTKPNIVNNGRKNVLHVQMKHHDVTHEGTCRQKPRRERKREKRRLTCETVVFVCHYGLWYGKTSMDYCRYLVVFRVPYIASTDPILLEKH